MFFFSLVENKELVWIGCVDWIGIKRLSTHFSPPRPDALAKSKEQGCSGFRQFQPTICCAATLAKKLQEDNCNEKSFYLHIACSFLAAPYGSASTIWNQNIACKHTIKRINKMGDWIVALKEERTNKLYVEVFGVL